MAFALLGRAKERLYGRKDCSRHTYQADCDLDPDTGSCARSIPQCREDRGPADGGEEYYEETENTMKTRVIRRGLKVADLENPDSDVPTAKRIMSVHSNLSHHLTT